jgi:hypothetical protein
LVHGSADVTVGGVLRVWMIALALGCGQPPAAAPGLPDAGPEHIAPNVEHPPTAEPAVEPRAGDVVSIPEGILRAGSMPGTPNRRPSVEADLVELRVPAFDIDRLPYPNDPARPATLVASRRDAAAMCASEGRRLCHELEWERACKADTSAAFATGEELPIEACIADRSACASPLGVLDLGVRAPEWTSSDAGERLARLDRTAVVRGARSDAEIAAHRCGARSALAPESTSPAAFRCCGGPAPELEYPDVGLRRVFRDLTLEEPRVREILASVPQTARLANDFRAYTVEDGVRALGRGNATIEAVTWEMAPGLFAWSPSVGEEVWVFAGRSGESTLLAALYPRPDGTFLHAASFVFADEVAPLAILRDRGSRHELLWSACWGCAGESGVVRFDETSRIVIAQQ